MSQQVVFHGTGTGFGQRPRIIWSYWHDPAGHPLIDACRRSWETSASGYEIRLLNSSTVETYTGRIPWWVRKLKQAAISDWIRLKLIRDHGGIWLDATFLLLKPIGEALPEQALSGSEAFLYCNRKWTRDPASPMMESWFISAPPGHPLIERWFAAYNLACVNRRIYLWIARHRFGFDAIYQGYPRIRYYTVFAVFQCVLRSGTFGFNYLDSEEGPYSLHAAVDYDPERIADMLTEPAAADLASIKIASDARRSIMARVAAGKVAPDSILGQLGLS